jgi:hypothetical protein
MKNNDRFVAPLSTKCIKRETIYVRPNFEARSCNNSFRVRAIRITYSACVFVAFHIHNAKRMRHIILPSVAVWLYHTFPVYDINRKIFGKGLLNIKCVF